MYMYSRVKSEKAFRRGETKDGKPSRRFCLQTCRLPPSSLICSPFTIINSNLPFDSFVSVSSTEDENMGVDFTLKISCLIQPTIIRYGLIINPR